MPQPEQGAPIDRAQKSGHEIAAAIDQGVKEKDLSVAVTKMREEMKADENNPAAKAAALKAINEDIGKIPDQRVRQILSNFTVEGYDAKNDGIVLKNRQTGEQISLLKNFDVVNLQTGARLRQNSRDSQGLKSHAELSDGTKIDRTVSENGRVEVSKLSKDGKEWTIQRERQSDGSMRPTRVTHPNGSSIEYRWDKDGNKLVMTAFTERDNKGSVVQDYTRDTFEAGGKKRYDPAGWTKKSGPGPEKVRGTVDVDRNINHKQEFRDPPMSLTIEPNGKYKLSTIKDNKPFNEEGERK